MITKIYFYLAIKKSYPYWKLGNLFTKHNRSALKNLSQAKKKKEVWLLSSEQFPWFPCKLFNFQSFSITQEACVMKPIPLNTIVNSNSREYENWKVNCSILLTGYRLSESNIWSGMANSLNPLPLFSMHYAWSVSPSVIEGFPAFVPHCSLVELFSFMIPMIPEEWLLPFSFPLRDFRMVLHSLFCFSILFLHSGSIFFEI